MNGSNLAQCVIFLHWGCEIQDGAWRVSEELSVAHGEHQGSSAVAVERSS